MKVCSKCKVEKSFDSFTKDKHRPDGFKIYCKSCIKNNYKKKDLTIEQKEQLRITNKNWRESNKEYLKIKKKEYYENNKEHCILKAKTNYLNNKEKYNETKRVYIVNKLKNNSNFKFKSSISNLIRCSFYRACNGTYKKSNKTEEILGCSISEFSLYLQKQFKDGMSFENYGKWHIDHIIPLASAKNEEEIIKLNHYTNLQPLWASDNIKKSNKLI
jgi:hypothetical protein